MTEPKHKITVQDVTDKITNTREDMLNKQELQKPFIFKGYTSELDRIKDTIKNNRYRFNLPEPEIKNSKSNDKLNNYNNNQMTYSQKYQTNLLIPTNKRINEDTILKSNNIDYFIKNDIIIQPQMRFKARTDLERVYEALNGKIYRDNERNILNRQLKNIDLFTYKKPKDLLKLNSIVNNKVENEKENNENEENKKGYKIIPHPHIEDKEEKKNLKRNIYANSKIYYIPTTNERWKKRTDLNIEAEGILKEYHYKTHFKAAEEIAENRLDSKKIEKEKNYLTNSSRLFKKKKIFNFDDDVEKKLKKYDFKNYSKNYNPIKKNRGKSMDPESMKILTSLAFKNNDDKKNKEDEKNHSLEKIDIESKKKLIDENNVLIGNEIFYKGTQFNIIANKVLNLCNVYHKKNRHNDTILKKGNGKMMFSQGLTLNQFGEKYHLYD